MKAAMDAAFAGVLTDEMEIQFNGAPAGTTEKRLAKEVYIPQMSLAHRHMVTLGWCPVVLVPVGVRGDDDEYRQEKYEAKKNDLKVVAAEVFIIPEPMTYRAYLTIDTYGRQSITAISTLDKEVRVHIIRSIMHKGPSVSSLLVSTPIGVLQDPFNKLKRIERIAEQVYLISAVPVLYAEFAPPTAHQVESNRAMRATADTVLEMQEQPVMYNQKTNDTTECKRQRRYDDMLETISTGGAVDPKDAMTFLPENYRLPSQPPSNRTAPDVYAANAEFERHVGAVFRVPDSFLTGATGNGISDAQNGKASEHDVHRMRQAIDVVCEDLKYFVQEAVKLLMSGVDGEPEVILPVVGLAGLADLQELYMSNIIDGDTLRRHGARAVGMSRDHVLKGSKLILPPRLDKADVKNTP